jgi:hypothetical protein
MRNGLNDSWNCSGSMGSFASACSSNGAPGRSQQGTLAPIFTFDSAIGWAEWHPGHVEDTAGRLATPHHSHTCSCPICSAVFCSCSSGPASARTSFTSACTAQQHCSYNVTMLASRDGLALPTSANMEQLRVQSKRVIVMGARAQMVHRALGATSCMAPAHAPHLGLVGGHQAGHQGDELVAVQRVVHAVEHELRGHQLVCRVQLQ